MHPFQPCALLLVVAAVSAAPSPRADEALPPGVSNAAAHLHRHAHDLAQAPARRLSAPLPEEYTSLDYDAYRSIRANKARRIRLGDGTFFSAELIHLGAGYRVPVSFGIWDETGAVPGYENVAYEPDLFTFPEGLAPLEGEAGFAGVRFFSEDSMGEEPTEFLVFHGASYFRAVGRTHGFGSSSRCVALGTAEAGGEEFPAVTNVLVEPPRAGERSLRVHALLESKSLTGVMSMIATPGAETAMDVEVTVYPRVDLTTVGIAPLTSMFYFDRGLDHSSVDDVRSAVHDAHGLKVITGAGERLWRPLVNPAALQVSAFLDDSPLGFGLVQRSREFGDFADAEARYERRPSLWIEPLPDAEGRGWGPGAVHLVEIPTATEFNDNVVAFWRPKEPLRGGEAHRFAYRMVWCDEPADRSPTWRVKDSRTGLAPNDGRRLFVVDFEREGAGPMDLSGVGVAASASVGEVLGARLETLPDGRTCRATVTFEPGEEVGVAEISLRLERTVAGADGDERGDSGDTEVLSERWIHRWVR